MSMSTPGFNSGGEFSPQLPMESQFSAASSPGGPQPSTAPLQAFQDAQAKTDQQKVALLTAVAQLGSQGKAAYNQQQAWNASQRQQALQAAAGSALGAGQQPSAITNAITAAFGDRAESQFQQQGAMQNYTTQLQQAAGTWFDQAHAAVPVMEARTRQQVNEYYQQQQLERQRAQEEQQAKQQAAALQQQQLQLEIQSREQQSRLQQQQLQMESAQKSIDLQIAQANLATARERTTTASYGVEKAEISSQEKYDKKTMKLIQDGFGDVLNRINAVGGGPASATTIVGEVIKRAGNGANAAAAAQGLIDAASGTTSDFLSNPDNRKIVTDLLNYYYTGDTTNSPLLTWMSPTLPTQQTISRTQ